MSTQTQKRPKATAQLEISRLTQRDAEMCIKRSSELSGPKGKFCIRVAKEIIAKTVTLKDLKEFESYSSFIKLSFL